MLQKQVLERLILKRLQMQQAENLGIEVDEAALTEAMTNIAARNGLTLEQLRSTLEASGVSFENFREDTRLQILTARVQQQEVLQNIRVSDAEIDRFLKQEGDSLIERREVRLQHILVALPDNPTNSQVETARNKASTLLKRVRGGTSFADVAAANSDGRRALEGGDLGWFPISEVPSLALVPAQTLAKGETSEPIQSPSGFHLIRISDIKGDAPEPMSQTHARHILIRTNEIVSDDDAKLRLSQLRLRIVGGDDFATLARAHSDDTGSALKGGDLGWVNRGDTVPEFEEAMDKLAANEISQPFRVARLGWHIVQVIERRKQDTTDELMRMKAEDAIRQRKGRGSHRDLAAPAARRGLCRSAHRYRFMTIPILRPPRIALSPGEPAGIGPDLCVLLAQTAHAAELIAISDPRLLYERAEHLHLPIQLLPFDPQKPPCSQPPGTLYIDTGTERPTDPQPTLTSAVVPGQLNPEHAVYVLDTLTRACDGCLQGYFDAMVTAPVHKAIINDAGLDFIGHTRVSRRAPACQPGDDADRTRPASGIGHYPPPIA